MASDPNNKPAPGTLTDLLVAVYLKWAHAEQVYWRQVEQRAAEIALSGPRGELSPCALDPCDPLLKDHPAISEEDRQAARARKKQITALVRRVAEGEVTLLGWETNGIDTAAWDYCSYIPVYKSLGPAENDVRNLPAGTSRTRWTEVWKWLKQNLLERFEVLCSGERLDAFAEAVSNGVQPEDKAISAELKRLEPERILKELITKLAAKYPEQTVDLGLCPGCKSTGLVVSKSAWRVLEDLARLSYPVTALDMSGRIGMDRGGVSAAYKDLVSAGLAFYPGGSRGGVAITVSGREFVKKV